MMMIDDDDGGWMIRMVGMGRAGGSYGQLETSNKVCK